MDYSDSLKILRKDRRFVSLIKKQGQPELDRGFTVYQALLRSIIYQQLSGKAAATILLRFKKLFGGKFPTPAQLQTVSLEKLRSAGLSRTKALYLKDVADKFADGTIKHRKFSRMTSPEIIEHLIQIKGVGVWTVHMLLIFTLGRRDILPTGDLGVRKGFQIIYKLQTLPTHAEMERLAKPWREHASVASWYLWRAADEKK